MGWVEWILDNFFGIRTIYLGDKEDKLYYKAIRNQTIWPYKKWEHEVARNFDGAFYSFLIELKPRLYSGKSKGSILSIEFNPTNRDHIKTLHDFNFIKKCLIDLRLFLLKKQKSNLNKQLIKIIRLNDNLIERIEYLENFYKSAEFLSSKDWLNKEYTSMKRDEIIKIGIDFVNAVAETRDLFNELAKCLLDFYGE